MTQARGYKPPPPNFCQNFVRGGWRKAERMYGSRTEVIVNWYHVCGGRKLGQMAYKYRSGALEVLDLAREMDQQRRTKNAAVTGPITDVAIGAVSDALKAA